MSAPQYVPTSPVATPRSYQSPDFVPSAWNPGRPAELTGHQPSGDQQGYQGPDQGYALTLAARLRDRIRTSGKVTVDDAVRGCLGIALRRASLYGRAPVIHDLTIAFTAWGFLDENPPAELVELRSRLFEGAGNVLHHYAEGRAIADLVPETTLRMTPQQVAAKYPGSWRELLGQ
ncbi:MAG: hypothetical protein R2705_19080 [Ilumatobacteraceae bacterium]